MTDYKLVPVEPTEAMLDAGQLDGFFAHSAVNALWHALLSAAPEPVSDPYKLASGEIQSDINKAFAMQDAGYTIDWMQVAQQIEGIVINAAQPLNNAQELEAAPVVGEPVDLISLDHVALHLSHIGCIEFGNLVVEAAVEITSLRDKIDVAVKVLERMVQLYESECDPENLKRPDWLVEAIAQIKGGA